MVHPINYQTWNKCFEHELSIKTGIQDLLEEMESKLDLVAEVLISLRNKFLSIICFKLKHLSVLVNERKVKLLEKGDYDDVQWALQDLLEYQTEQVQKIKSIVRVLAKLNLNDNLLKKQPRSQIHHTSRLRFKEIGFSFFI